MKNKSEDKPRDDGTIRKAHYGSGRQPWDDIVEQGWGPIFAAANVLKYLRRTKDLEHSLESARWYYNRLREMRDEDVYSTPATICYHKLRNALTKEELALLK